MKVIPKVVTYNCLLLVEKQHQDPVVIFKGADLFRTPLEYINMLFIHCLDVKHLVVS